MRSLPFLLRLGVVGLVAGYLYERAGRTLPLEKDARERGRFAARPQDMTWLGWKDIAARTWRETMDDRLVSVGAGVAFYSLVALAPAVSVLVSLFGLIADPRDVVARLAPFLTALPDAARSIVVEQAARLSSQSNASLSIKLVAGLAIAAWSANAAIKSMFDALNVIYEEDEKRSFLKLNAVSLLTTVSAIALVTFAMFVIAVAPALIERAPFGAALETLVKLLRWPVFYLVAVGAVATLYWIGPSRRPARFVWVLPGALLAALLWALASAGFSFYVARFGSYEATYGSLAAVVVFMTWLWASACVILVGAELNSELEHQTARATTVGMPKPIGLRGAQMADRIGPSSAR